MGDTIDFLTDIFRRKKSKKNQSTPIYSPPSSSRTSSNSEQEEAIGTNGNTFYIKDCTGITIGDQNTYYTGPVTYNQNQYSSNVNTSQLHDLLEEGEPEMMKKDNDVVLLMECTSKPTSTYLSHTAEYIGRGWRRTFINLGIDERIIENCVYENPRKHIQEIRYEILLDWLRNSENATLGYLSTKLWENGHCRLVNDLSSMYREERLNREPQSSSTGMKEWVKTKLKNQSRSKLDYKF